MGPATMKPDEDGTGGGGRGVLLVALLVVGSIAALLSWALAPIGGGDGAERMAGSRREGVALKPGDLFIGSSACRDCHPGEWAAHVNSGHSRTFRPAGASPLASWLVGRETPDPERPGVSWSFEPNEGADTLTLARAEAGETARQVVEFAVGSGRHAQTFVSRRPGDRAHPLREHRLTYFAHREEMDITPGQHGDDPGSGTGPMGRDLTPDLALKCVNCHVTIPSAEGFERFDPSTMIANVECEKCHGPGRDHVENARRGVEGPRLAMPFGPGRWTADLQMKLCGDCHRHPDLAPPGSVRPDNDELVRFQPVGLMQSACYARSAGRLSCVSCHDPHSRASRDLPAYEAACLKCHDDKGPGRAVCSVNPKSGCVACHMPRRNAGQGILFTDHWIRTP